MPIDHESPPLVPKIMGITGKVSTIARLLNRICIMLLFDKPANTYRDAEVPAYFSTNSWVDENVPSCQSVGHGLLV